MTDDRSDPAFGLGLRIIVGLQIIEWWRISIQPVGRALKDMAGVSQGTTPSSLHSVLAQDQGRAADRAGEIRMRQSFVRTVGQGARPARPLRGPRPNPF